MDQNRLRDICQEALDTSFNGINITEFRAIPTHFYDEGSNMWVPDSYSLFIVLKKLPVDYKDKNYSHFEDAFSSSKMENFLESLLGFECCVDFT